MTTYNIPRSWTVGFDQLFDRIESAQSNQQSYPPHNVVKHGEDSFEIAVAVAGFSKNDLFVEQEENVLTISSKDVDLNGNKQYLHKGIGTRKFKKQFTLGEYIDVTDVTLVDGILSVFLQKNIPEEKKPRTFVINGGKSGNDTEFLAE